MHCEPEAFVMRQAQPKGCGAVGPHTAEHSCAERSCAGHICAGPGTAEAPVPQPTHVPGAGERTHATDSSATSAGGSTSSIASTSSAADTSAAGLSFELGRGGP